MGETCAVCGRKLGGLLGLVSADEEELKTYREKGENIPTPLCHACSLPYVQKAKESLHLLEPNHTLSAKIPDISIYTFNPFALRNDYTNLGLITSHVALGTGPFAGILSSIEDLAGEQSDIYDRKMQKATQACLDKLKIKAASVGADAAIGVQVSYTELTAGHGMVMVCMSGTAVKSTFPPIVTSNA